MLLCGIIDELEKLPADTRILSYFFCQAADARLNNATAVLRGLIYQLLDQEPSLIEHVRKKYDHAGKQLFEDVNSWDVLSKMFTSILEELSLQKNTYLVIDALDECQIDLSQLLHLVIQIPSSTHAKLIVSSRNWPVIEDALDDATQKIQLELNQQSISAAVSRYIQYKVHQLAQWKNYDNKTRDAVQQHLASNANDTFLWVSLVCQELADPKVRRWHTRAKLHTFPPGLNSLYVRMIDHLFDSVDADLCSQILSLVSTVYRPLHLEELRFLVDLPEDFPNDDESLIEIIGLCGSLLTLQEGVINFIHQSARDFILNNESKRIHLNYITQKDIALRSIQLMSRTLRRDLYNLRSPGFPINRVEPPASNPLVHTKYSCIYWVNHLVAGDLVELGQCDRVLQDGGPVHAFLKQHYLHWLEALSLLRSVSEGILQMSKLVHLTQVHLDRQPLHRKIVNANNMQVSEETPQLKKLAYDGLRFFRTHRSSIEVSPLQVYTSALIFSPIRSTIRELFHHEEPAWVAKKPAMEDDWNPCLQTLEGHRERVNSVAFSRDGTQLASASNDNTVRVWDSATGQCLQTLEDHSDRVISISFSGDGKQLASASDDTTIKVWDSGTGQCLQTLKGHVLPIKLVAFSCNSSQLASASYDDTIKVWDSATGQCFWTLEGYCNNLNSVAFSDDITRLASESENNTIMIRNSSTGQWLQTLQGHRANIYAVIFSRNGKKLASASRDKTIRIWDINTGQCHQTLEAYGEAIAFSGNSMQLASVPNGTTIKVWDITTGNCLQILKGHSDFVCSVSFSGGSTQLASGSSDCTVKVWDGATGQYFQTLESHSSPVNSITYSGDGRKLASGSWDRTIKVWDSITGQCFHTLMGHGGAIYAVAFSSDGRQLASASDDKTIRVWDSATGQCLYILEGHRSYVKSVAFSSDSRRLASASDDTTIRVWDVATGHFIQALNGHRGPVHAIAFTGDGTQLVSASWDQTIKAWDVATGHCLRTLVIGQNISEISYPRIALQLCKELGAVGLERTTALCTAKTVSQRLTGTTEIPQLYGYAVSADNMWITRDSVNLLWLPPEYQPVKTVSIGSMLAIGCDSGRVLVFRFSEGELLV